MLIYSNNNNNNANNNSLFGDEGYKSVHNGKQSVNRMRDTKHYTQQNKRVQTKHKSKSKNLTIKNVKFLKSLGIKVKKQ